MIITCVILCHQKLFKRLTHLRTVCINHVYAHLRVHMYNGCSCNKVAHKFCARQRLVEQIAVMYSHRSIRTWRRQWTRHSSCQTVLSTYCSLPFSKSGLECGFLLRVSSDEQFQRCSRNWYWHSCSAICTPCIADAATSGCRAQMSYCVWLRPGYDLQTVFKSSGVSVGRSRPSMSLA